MSSSTSASRLVSAPISLGPVLVGAPTDRSSAEVDLAMVVQRFLVDGPPVPDDYVVSVLDGVVMPLLRPVGPVP